MEGERNVTQVVEETGRNQANVSKHLKMLAEAGLVARRKEGLQVIYALMTRWSSGSASWFARRSSRKRAASRPPTRTTRSVGCESLMSNRPIRGVGFKSAS